VAWKKEGLLFAAPPPVAWGVSHAALPVARTNGDATELYFSSRDAVGRSHIGRATLAADLRGAPTFEEEPLLAPGELGTFDDSGVTVGCIVEDGDVTNLYYSGWTRGETVPFYFYVGCARSMDGGRTFARISAAPILERNAVDPYLTASPWILVEDGLWRMWYVSGTGWEKRDGTPQHRYHIKYAESRDGVVWTREGHVCIDYRAEDEYAIARPTVVRDGDRYRMWYCSRGPFYRLGYAESADGVFWDRRDEEAGLEPSRTGWDSQMVCYPAVYEHVGRRYLLYNGNGFGATGVGYALDTET
jgi:hypothetical protein